MMPLSDYIIIKNQSIIWYSEEDYYKDQSIIWYSEEDYYKDQSIIWYSEEDFYYIVHLHYTLLSFDLL